ncbi:MAG: RagB/SusD family nutrient uptake outer membrane protein [Williamsia sp.]|nr:RagB/SusD family nutrient uptake outer membrane protein [Williamsia sp.]
MQATSKYFGAVIFLWLAASSCSKSFLDKTPYTSNDLSSAISNEADLGVAVNGMYASLRATDLYGRSVPLKGDLLADNAFVATANSGRYLTVNNVSFTNSDSYATGLWQNAYIAIKYANTVINNTLPVSAAVSQYMGEAYAVRALMHFELVRNFAHPYTSAPNDPGVPLVTRFNISSFDPFALPARNTVKEVYTQVVADLDTAYARMSLYKGTAYFSKYAAKALQARVYQHMGDWASAKTAALDVINNSGWAMLAPSAYVSPSGSVSAGTYSPGGYWANPAVQASSKNETLFEVACDITNNGGFDQLGGIYLTTGGYYGDILGVADVYNLYASTDVRRGLMATGTRSGQSGTAYFSYKYPNASNTVDKDDIKVLRLSDIILIAAEASYNTGDIPNALVYLNRVAKQRDPVFAGYASTGTQVLEDILTERRKELAYEGVRLWDLIRLGRSWTKIKNQNPLTTVGITPTSTALLYPIPVAEINANKNISQNPGY